MGSHVSPPRLLWAAGVTAAAVGRFQQRQLSKPPKRCSPDWLKGYPVEGAGVQLSAVKHLVNPNSPYTGHLLSHLQDTPGMVKAIGAGLPRRGDRDQMGGFRLQQQVLPGQMLNSFCQVTGLTAEDHPRDSHLGPRESVLPQPPALLGACEGVEVYGGDAGHLGLHQHPIATPVGHQRIVVDPSPTVDYQRQSSVVHEGQNGQ